MTTATPTKNTYVHIGDHRCGFCSTGNCEQCPVKIGNATKASPDRIWTCPCPCTKDRKPRCRLCKHEGGEGEVGPVSWLCLDKNACDARREAKLASNPLVQFIEGWKERKKMTTATEPKAPKAPKTGNCLHCGEVTKGGKFLPGHDAAFVSDQVGLVMADPKNEKKARVAMGETSEALQKKFERSLELAREKQAKQEKAKADKAAADKAKAAEAKEKAAAAKAAKDAEKAK